jgi:hypothetical protein
MASEVTFWVLSTKDSTSFYALHKFAVTGELLETIDTDIEPIGVYDPVIGAQNDTVVFGDGQYFHTLLGDRSFSSYEWCDPEIYENARMMRVTINNGAFGVLAKQYFYDNETYYESPDGINWTLTPLFENILTRGVVDVRWFAPESKYAVLWEDPSGEVIGGYYRFTTAFEVFSDPTEHLPGRTFGCGTGSLYHVFTVGSKFFAPSYDASGTLTPVILSQTGTTGSQVALPLNPVEHRPADGANGFLFFDTADGVLTAAYDNGSGWDLFKLNTGGDAFVYSGIGTSLQEARLASVINIFDAPYLVVTAAGPVGLGVITEHVGVTSTALVPLSLPSGYSATNAFCMDAQDVSLFWTENIRTREYL